jgi:serine/threonine-protein phosphatase 2B catalytic subunit
LAILPNPYNDRHCTDQECPTFINRPLSDDQLFLKTGIPNWKTLKEHYCREGPVNKSQCLRILKATLNLLKTEPNLASIDEPICVVGDLHGQYFDMLNMISKAGEPGSINYLFLGDYVDRGVLGIEVVLLLFAIKLNEPKSVVLLRGNHESRNMTEAFTFREEVLERYDVEVYDFFMEVFDALPIAALVAKKYLAMHGGISPELNKLDQINAVNRF